MLNGSQTLLEDIPLPHGTFLLLTLAAGLQSKMCSPLSCRKLMTWKAYQKQEGGKGKHTSALQ